MNLSLCRKRLTKALIGGLPLLFLACLEPQKTSNQTPQVPAPETSQPEVPTEIPNAQARLSLSKLSLTNLPANAAELRVQVYTVAANQRAEKPGDIQRFAPADENLLRLAELKPGPYDVLSEIWSEDGQRLGISETRALLLAGEQELKEWNWRWDRPMSSEAKLELNFAVEVVSPSEPEEVRATLKASCVGCHSTSRKRGQLILDTFPYRSENPDTAALGLAGIASLNSSRVDDTVAPMPPAPLKPLADDKRLILSQFAKRLQAFDQTLKDAESLLGDADFVLVLSDKTQIRSTLRRSGLQYFLEPVITLPTGQEFIYNLTLRNKEGAVLLEQKGQSLKVPENGALSIKLPLTF